MVMIGNDRIAYLRFSHAMFVSNCGIDFVIRNPLLRTTQYDCYRCFDLRQRFHVVGSGKKSEKKQLNFYNISNRY